ncbi:CDP-diacylglycerol O-phosphatidyltransferase [Intrasporangium oryzae NRRL B-24470]|uniref:CDP-diacylglycerol O-phosphatidyltransferase n=1 Tax=Intrasporangium oryzae NRRL B-24470 TaxID=1386089 RepID=W9GD71_9MICO|nr:phosphatidylcholine/phosphatidylserine synthase [Intrasporangium oryzae]EWT01819.1 CDP-diacylglycerol O-phosphatidyltransferase [Intrasporangium oryzae NRRL B-24470]
MSGDPSGARRPRRRDRVTRGIRLVSATGARVVPLSRLNPRVRARVMLPSLFTLGNMLCGFSSVLLSFQGHFRWAAVLIAVSILLDISDGAVARAVGAITPFGLQFDSLADLISFGIAPAVLVYTWALPAYPVWAWAGAMFWLACAAYRLARFNVTIDPLADKRYFVGLASPGAAGVVIATVFAIDGPLGSGERILPVVAGVLPAALMASSFRFRSFRSLLSTQNLPLTLGVVVAVVIGLVVAPGPTGLVIAYGYVLTCPLGWVTAPLRRRWFGPDAVAPPRTKLPSVLMPQGEAEDEVDISDEPDLQDDFEDADVVEIDEPDQPDEPDAWTAPDEGFGTAAPNPGGDTRHGG